MECSLRNVLHPESWFVAFGTHNTIFKFASVKYAVINADMKNNFRHKIWPNYFIGLLVGSWKDVAFRQN